MSVRGERLGGAAMIGLGILVGIVGLVTTSRVAGILATVLLIAGAFMVAASVRREYVTASRPSMLGYVTGSASQSSRKKARSAMGRGSLSSTTPATRTQGPDPVVSFAASLKAELAEIASSTSRARVSSGGAGVDELRDRLALLVASPLYAQGLSRGLIDASSVADVAASLRAKGSQQEPA